MSRTTFHSENDLAQAYDQFADAIFRHCYFRTFDRELGKKLMLETFQKTWRFISEGNVIDNMRAFLYRTANELVTQADFAGEQAAINQSLSPEYKILATLKKLTPQEREIFIMAHIDGLPQEEISEILGRSVKACALHLKSSLQKLSSPASNAR